MSNQKEIVQAWINKERGAASHIRSDGISLWSYDWYEIARHVGEKVAFIRHSNEGYSNTTKKQISLVKVEAHIRELELLPASNPESTRNSKIGEPDWEWLRWVYWFNNLLPWTVDFLVKLNPIFKAPGSSILSQASRNDCVIALKSLSIEKNGHGLLRFDHTSHVDKITLNEKIVIYKVNRHPTGAIYRTVELDRLIRVDPPLSISEILVSKHKSISNWKSLLFRHYPSPIDLRNIFSIDVTKC